MPAELNWLQEPDILISTFSGVITTEDIESWSAQFVDRLEGTSQPVHSICDLTSVERIAANVVKIPGVVQVARHPRLGLTILVGTSPLSSFFATLLGKMVGFTFQSAASLDEAISFVERLPKSISKVKGAIN